MLAPSELPTGNKKMHGGARSRTEPTGMHLVPARPTSWGRRHSCMATCHQHELGHPQPGLEGWRWPSSWGRTLWWGDPDQGADSSCSKCWSTICRNELGWHWSPSPQEPYFGTSLSWPSKYTSPSLSPHMLTSHRWAAKLLLEWSLYLPPAVGI